MSIDHILNARKSRLTGLPYTAGDTVLAVEVNDFAGADPPFNLVIYDRLLGGAAEARQAGRFEIVRVTAMNEDELTVTRAQEGTTAIALDGDGLWDIIMAPTKIIFDQVITAIDGKEDSFSKNTGFNKQFGSTAGTVVEGNDERISTALNGKLDVVNIKQFGFVGDGVTDDSQAIEGALNAIEDGQILVFPDFDVSLIDREFIVNKKITIIGSRGILKLKDNADIWSGESYRKTIFKIIKSGVRINGLNIDGNSRNNFIEDDGVKIYYSVTGDSVYPTGVNSIDIIAGHVGGDIAVKDVIVENCILKDSSASTLSANGDHPSEDAWGEAAEQYVENIIFRKNTLIGGQRAVLNFTNGAKRCFAYGNTFVDNYWNAINFYQKAFGCEAYNNLVLADFDRINEDFANREGENITRFGIRFGHSTRNPGSVHHCKAYNNSLWAIGSPNSTNGVGPAIILREDVTNNEIKDNYLHIPATSRGIEFDAAGEHNIIMGNTIISPRIDALLVLNSSPSIISNNTIKGANTSEVNNRAVRIENSEGIIVSHNTLISDPSYGEFGNGINLSSLNGANIMQANTFLGVSNPYSNSSSSTIYRNLIESGSPAFPYSQLPWTPTDASGAGLSLTASEALNTYVRIGNMFFVTIDITYPSTSNSANTLIGGLPASTYENFAFGGLGLRTDASQKISMEVVGNQIRLYNADNLNTRITNLQMSGKRLWAILMFRS